MYVLTLAFGIDVDVVVVVVAVTTAVNAVVAVENSKSFASVDYVKCFLLPFKTVLLVVAVDVLVTCVFVVGHG